ncbi:MAG: hypothetical protein HYR72_14785 [Deltaproteobacteria bacterium]|nr:hypothetical protein [Deltaproteobacteria bacterium]MBI3390870.1 hypothetical protein [Deltaproteobacteria bacterium]
MPAQQPWQPETLLHELFGPDHVLPEQFYGSNDNATRLSGERALMWAVFADGIDCYRRNVGQATRRELADFREAERWIRANDWEWAFSFVNLCEVFGFQPAAVRRALSDWRIQRSRAPFRRQRFRPVTLHAAA